MRLAMRRRRTAISRRARRSARAFSFPDRGRPMLTLYGTQGSGSAAVEAALEIASLHYRQVEAASWKPSPGLDELRALIPLAQIPTLRLDDGSILTESAAILIHLGLAHRASGLLASEPS